MDLDLPLLYLLPFNLSPGELQEWENKIPSLTCDANETKIFVGKISQKPRAQLELRKLQLLTEEASPMKDQLSPTHRAKRRKVLDLEEYGLRSDSSTASEDGMSTSDSVSQDNLQVVRLSWLEDSIAKGKVLDYKDYLVYDGRKVTEAPAEKPGEIAGSQRSKELLRRAREAAVPSQTRLSPYRAHRRKRDGDGRIKVAPFLPQSTTEEKVLADLPPLPDYLLTPYSCQRPTSVHPPNEAFIEKLKQVRELRAMRRDEIGVRAYSTAIASISAYPYKLQSQAEVSRLPGCHVKFARLFGEFQETGQLIELQNVANDDETSIIKTFYDIWGVSSVTAEHFYRKGWRDLDDIVECGWKSIKRQQQIGVKYYDEFLQKIPRSETESIAKVVLQHANRIRSGYHITIVGGYRRGKTMSGDVDLILSHPDQAATDSFIEQLVISLKEANFITHTLSLTTRNSERGQNPTSFKASASGGTGFDTLDKALVVWQNPDFKRTSSSTKNTNPHRRVDIIISPWKTVGCAVLGWTSETTFQRDLRIYCRKEKNLKFDSSGIRSRDPPHSWVDLEDGGRGRPNTMEEAEKEVFEGLGLVWRPPEERCTG